MRLVVDTNIVIAALITRSKTHEIILEAGLELFAPEYMLNEIDKHEETIKEKGGMTEQEFQEAKETVLENITLVPTQEYGKYLKKALEDCPDTNDWPFLALAMKLNCVLWSNDRKLKEQREVEIVCTEELIGSLGSWQQD